MALTPKKSRTSAVRLIASTSSPNCRSAIPPGVTICDVLAGDIAMTPSGMPSTMFTVNGSVAGAPLVYVMFAAIRGKLAPPKDGLNVHASTAEQPPDCMRRNSASPLSSSWLPIAEASIFIRFKSSTVGSSLNIADSSADDPQLSPTEYSSELVAWLRSCVT